MQNKFLIGFSVVFIIGITVPEIISQYFRSNPLLLLHYLPIIQVAMPLFILALVMGFIIWFRKGLQPSKKEQAYLNQLGERSTAQILAVEDTGITISNINLVIKLTLLVQPQNRPTFTTSIETVVSRVQIPRPGELIQVVFDPQAPHNIMLAS